MMAGIISFIVLVLAVALGVIVARMFGGSSRTAG